MNALRPTNKELTEQYFSEHEAMLYETDRVQILTWCRPGSSFGYMRFVFCLGTLSVAGDFGYAVFQWHYSVTDIRSLRDIDLTYMLSKCRTSEVGTHFVEWSVEDSIADLQQMFDSRFPPELDEAATAEQDAKTREVWDRLKRDSLFREGDSRDVFLNNLYHDQDYQQVFGTEAETLSNIGVRPHLNARLMPLGLLKALQELK